jgi:glycosyltransferase involved in cell wall biosynthesis
VKDLQLDQARSMKIALISFDFEEYCVHLASALTEFAEVLLLLPTRFAGPYVSALDPRVHVHTFDKPRLRQAGRQMLLVSGVLRRIKCFRPDVVHLQQGHLWFNWFLPLLRRYPLVVTVHDPRFHTGDRESQKTPQAVMDFGFHRAAHLIAHCAHTRDVLISTCRIAPDIVTIVPHLKANDGPDQPTAEDDGSTVLFFGRIWEYKGLEYLIRAEPLITARVPAARIVIAGQGEDFQRYRRLMVHPDRFVVHNEYVSHERRGELFRQASVVVLPYIDASQSGVIPVAYTFMKPVVATTVGGLPEVVDDGVTGYLVPPRDERALATAVIRLLTDEGHRRLLGMNGRRKLDAEYSPRVVARQTFAVYRRAIEAARAPARAVVAAH